MKITLVSTENALTYAWLDAFKDVHDVNVAQGSIFSFPADAIVSPANSYGFMDGGLDYLITQALGEGVQEKVQMAIATEHNGELLVGQALTVLTHNAKWPYLISAPTMRVPTLLPSDTINPYLAAKAIFQQLRDDARINSIVVPGLGTGVGNVAPFVCAHQMRQAYDDVFINRTFPRTWREAQVRHQRLYKSVITDLQRVA